MRALVLALVFAGAPVQAQDPAPERAPALSDEELERRTREVASQIRCVVCQGVSLEDSPSTLAQEMRAVVREQLAAGRTPEEVKRYFVDRYGEWALLEPEPSGFNLLVYLLPLAMLLAGVVFVFLTMRRWTRARPAGAVAPEP